MIPAVAIAQRWHSVPGLELRHDLLPIRVLPAGDRLQVLVWDARKKRHVRPPRLAAHLEEAFELGAGMLCRLDMIEDARREVHHRAQARRTGTRRDVSADRDQVREIRRRLSDPVRVVHALNLGKGALRQSRGVTICCPWHGDRTPSCSVRVAEDGTIAVRCHACGHTSDVLGLVAQVNGLDVRREFRRVLERAAELAGVTLLARGRA